MTAPVFLPLRYFDRLRAHDWSYECSDDPGVYRRGAEEGRALRSIAEADPLARRMYDAWHAFIFGDRENEPTWEEFA